MEMRRNLVAVLAAAGLSACMSPAGSGAPATTTPQPVASTVVASPVAVATRETASAAPSVPTTPSGPIERGGLLFTWYRDAADAGAGRKVAFVMSRDGSNQRRVLADVTGDIRALGWRPDGDLMTFVVRDTAHPDGAIWSAAADGTGAALLYDGRSDGCTSVFHPVWSPDGTKLSLVCWVDRDPQHDAILSVLDVSTMKLSKLVTYPWPAALDNPARWSHDGSRIAYDVLHWDPTNTYLDGSRIATIGWKAGSKPHYLNELASFAATPSWSPDDKTLLYNTYDFGNMVEATTSDLFTMNADGTGVEPILAATDAGVARIGHAQWDADGARIWVGVRIGAGTYHIAWIDPATKQLTMLPTDGAGAEPRP
jgi:Tol biopolymer transport system component